MHASINTILFYSGRADAVTIGPEYLLQRVAKLLIIGDHEDRPPFLSGLGNSRQAIVLQAQREPGTDISSCGKLRQSGAGSR